MAGVEDPLGLTLGLVGRVLTRARDQFDLRPVRPHLEVLPGCVWAGTRILAVISPAAA